MKKNLQCVQWLFFLLSACLPFGLMAADAGTPASLAQNFPSTEPEFETLRDAEMIDNQPITALVQDTRGLIWIGTQTGLVRYDGYRFRKFAHKAGDPFSLAGDYVFSLAIAKDGRLWVGTNSDGISIFDPATERFDHFRHDEKRPASLGAGTIWGFAGDAQGGMWAATDQGLDYLPAGSRHFVHFRHGTDPHSLLDDKVRSLLLDKAGRLWVGSNSGLQRLAPDGKSFETIVAGKSVRTLFQAEDGKLWLGMRQHGAAWLMPAMTPAQVNWLPLAQLSHPWVREIVQVKPDQIWLATAGGGIVVLAAGDGQVVKTLRHDPMLPGSLALDSLKPMLLDRAGWLWVGTWGGGLQRMNANNTMLRVLRHSLKRPGGLSHPDVRSVLELNNGLLLIGSKGNGIDIFDRQRGLVGGYRPDSGAAQAGAFPDATVYALAQTRDGAVWAGTQQAGVLRQLPDSAAWVAVPGLPDKQVNKLFASRDGSLWAGTNLGVARWRPGQLASQRVPPSGQAAMPADRFEALADERGHPMEASTYALAEDAQGRIWVGTNNGLWLHEPGGKGLIRVPAQPERPDGLVSDSIPGLLLDRRGRLWVATDKGIVRLASWRDKQARFEHVSALLGADEKNQGENLLEDLQGRIWTGESMIDPDQMRMSRFTAADGASLNGTWIGAYGQTRDGLLLYGGANGMIIIDPARFKAHDYVPPLVVTELKINGVTVAPAAIGQASAQGKAGTLTLAPEQHNFALEFAALDYSDPRKNRYQYRLQGYEKDWINTSADHRIAAYGNLWPGTYTLQIRGSNRLGHWSAHELRIPVRVLPAWWQTWWFGLLLLVAMTGLVAALVQTRTRYLRRRQRELEQLVDKRTGQLRQKQSELVDANHGLNEANAELKLAVETLRQLGDIGREITANLDADIVFRSLHQYVGGLLDAPTMTIYRMNAASSVLEAVFGRDHDQVMPMRNIALDSPTSNAALAVRERRELLLHYELEEEPSDIPGTRQMLTVLFAPLIVDDHVLGVMSIQSDQKNAYGERECLIFRTLTAYGAIALANATAMASLRQAQGQLVQQEKMASLGGLVAGIAHEINTPLGTTLMAISGVESAWLTLQDAVATGQLSKSVLDASTEEGMEYTALALKTATRAAELIALFKTIAVNADSDRVAEIELADYLPEVATLIQNQLVQNGNKLMIAASPGLRMHVVPEALTEALSRILVNVLDHAFTDGRTGTLRLAAQGGEGDGADEVVITVSDDGHGIAKEDLPKVFDPFFTTKSGLHGHVGLGLHVAYNHVTQRLKGQIHVTSTLGEGTCVEIRLKKAWQHAKRGG